MGAVESWRQQGLGVVARAGEWVGACHTLCSTKLTNIGLSFPPDELETT